MTDPKDGRINLSPLDASERISDLERSAAYCQQEVSAVIEAYQLPRLCAPQVFQAKRHLRLAEEHFRCAAELAAKGGAD